MDIPSFKKTLISAYSTIDLKEDKLIIVTAAGLISGTPVLADEDETMPDAKFIVNMVDEYIGTHNLPTDIRFAGNDGLVILKDVTLKTSMASTTLPSMVIFIDQIIGITTGRYLD